MPRRKNTDNWAEAFKSAEDAGGYFRHADAPGADKNSTAIGSFGWLKNGHFKQAYENSKEFKHLRAKYGKDASKVHAQMSQGDYNSPMYKEAEAAYESWLKNKSGNNIEKAATFNLTGSFNPDPNWKGGNNMSWQSYSSKIAGTKPSAKSNTPTVVNYSGTSLPSTISTPNFAQYPDRSGGVPISMMSGFNYNAPIKSQSLQPIGKAPVFMMDENQLPGKGSPVKTKVPSYAIPLQENTTTIPGTGIPFTKYSAGTIDVEVPQQGYVTPNEIQPGGIEVGKSPWLTLENATKQYQTSPVSLSTETPTTKKKVNRSNTLGQLLPFASNLYNAFQKPGQVPRPTMDNPIALQRVNMANDRYEIERGVRGNNLSFDQTLDAQTAAANKQFTLAQRFNQLSKVNQEERNQNIEIANKETLMNHHIQSGNNAKMDQFWKDRLDRENVQKSQQSANVANAGDKAMSMYNNSQLQKLEDKRIQMQLALDDTGAMERFKKKNPDLFTYGLGGKLYSAGQFKRQTFKRIN